jgi:hypothetical protein
VPNATVYDALFPAWLCNVNLPAGLVRTGCGSSIYYIAASGSDSNNGTSKATPWLHAPGMVACSSACAAHTPQPGEQYIFQGGYVLHYGNSAATPYAGAQAGWTWSWSGIAGNPIYIGVDKTWYSGTSWTKPVLTGDNPTSTSFVSSCTYPFNSNPALFNEGSSSYVTFDNFEITGVCWTNQVANAGFINQNGGNATNDTISNLYCHGWTMTSAAYDNYVCVQAIGGGATVADNNVFAYDTFDGSDSPHFAAGTNCQWDNTNPCASGQGIQGHAYIVYGCIFRYLSNFMVTMNTETVHDNLFEYLYNTFASGLQQHPNVMNNLGGATGQAMSWYNNIMRHTYATENIYFGVRTVLYFFNNVQYDNMNAISGPAACIRLNSVSNSSSTQQAYIYNNTTDSSCLFKFEKANSPLTPWNGTGYFQNNHFIGFSPASLASAYVCDNPGYQCNVTDTSLTEVYQTVAVANGEGYTAANNYAPTLSSNDTVVVAGSNNSSSCSVFSADMALCSGTSGAVTQSGGNITYPAITIVARPATGSWNAGAYQFQLGM